MDRVPRADRVEALEAVKAEGNIQNEYFGRRSVFEQKRYRQYGSLPEYVSHAATEKDKVWKQLREQALAMEAFQQLDDHRESFRNRTLQLKQVTTPRKLSLSWAKDQVLGKSLQELVGQLAIVPLDAAEEELVDHVRERAVGGFLIREEMGLAQLQRAYPLKRLAQEYGSTQPFIIQEWYRDPIVWFNSKGSLPFEGRSTAASYENIGKALGKVCRHLGVHMQIFPRGDAFLGQRDLTKGLLSEGVLVCRWQKKLALSHLSIHSLEGENIAPVLVEKAFGEADRGFVISDLRFLHAQISKEVLAEEILLALSEGADMFIVPSSLVITYHEAMRYLLEQKLISDEEICHKVLKAAVAKGWMGVDREELEEPFFEESSLKAFYDAKKAFYKAAFPNIQFSPDIVIQVDGPLEAPFVQAMKKKGIATLYSTCDGSLQKVKEVQNKHHILVACYGPCLPLIAELSLMGKEVLVLYFSQEKNRFNIPENVRCVTLKEDDEAAQLACAELVLS